MDQHPVAEPEVAGRQGEATQLRANWTVAPAFASHFPLRFQSGVTVNALGFSCPTCQVPIRQEDARGEIAWLTPHTAKAEGYGFCKRCDVLVPINFAVSGEVGLNFDWHAKDGRVCATDVSWPTGLGRTVRRIHCHFRRLMGRPDLLNQPGKATQPGKA